MSRRWLALLLLLPLPAVPGRADTLTLGLEQRTRVESNLFKTPDEEERDGSYELQPSARFLRRGPLFQYDLFYQPSFDFYFENGELDNASHLFRGSMGHAPSRTELWTLSAEVSNYRSINAATQETTGIPDVLTDRDGRVTRVFGDLQYERQLDPAWIADARVGLQSYTFSDRNNVDNVGLDGEANLRHELRSNLAFGAGLAGGHRWFDEDRDRRLPASRTLVLSGGLLLEAEPFETLLLEVRGGPAVILTWLDAVSGSEVARFGTSGTGAATEAAVFDPVECSNERGDFVLSRCPLAPAPGLADRLDETVVVDFDPGQRPNVQRNDRFTGFVRASLTKEESWGNAAVAYSRWEEASAGLGAASVRDSLTATLEVLPLPRWRVRLRGNWNRREGSDTELSAVRAGPSGEPTGTGLFFAEATGLVPGVAEGRTEITQLWSDVRVLRSFLEDRLFLELGFRYLHQEREGVEGASVAFDNFIGLVGLRYEMRPWRYLE